jgi:hypothetical protein
MSIASRSRTQQNDIKPCGVLKLLPPAVWNPGVSQSWLVASTTCCLDLLAEILGICNIGNVSPTSSKKG